MSIRALNQTLPEFGLVIASATNAASGTTITPGNNAYGSYAQLIAGASVTDDVFGFWINLNTLAVSGSARDGLLKIGTDRSGGSSFTDTTIIDLLVSCAGANAGNNSGGIWYFLPFRLPAGTSIGAAVSVNNATIGACSAFVQLRCKPKYAPPRCATFMRAFGTAPSTSSGTALTPSNGSKSAYVQVGSALADQIWYWCLGVGSNNAVMQTVAGAFDLAVVVSMTINRRVIADQLVVCNTAEAQGFRSLGEYGLGNIGDKVFIRGGANGVWNTGCSVAAYGFGG